MLPGTFSRVERHSPKRASEEIRRRTEENIRLYKQAGREAIERRIAELDREWDMERLLETNAASVALAGIGLAAFKDRRWLALPAVVAGFLLQHALTGWCPPVELFRRLGVRTASEIKGEESALRAVRGDFDHLRKK